jgi:hypothetical protein
MGFCGSGKCIKLENFSGGILPPKEEMILLFTNLPYNTLGLLISLFVLPCIFLYFYFSPFILEKLVIRLLFLFALVGHDLNT